jgi:hypothetical protein
MIKSIWKYELEIGITKISMPEDAEILTAQMQLGEQCIWVLAEPHKPTITRTFRIIATGQPIDAEEKLNYIGTFQHENGKIVLHLFEEI